jgi:FtsH-binding integral membrane protein
MTSRRNAWPIAVAADLLVVIVFAAVGRSNHHESTGIHGVWHTVWPFALGTVLALALTAYTRTDPLSLRAGVRVWIWTLAIGMVVRVATGAGTALSFVIVAALVLAALFLGWRFALGWRRWRSRTRWFRRR